MRKEKDVEREEGHPSPIKDFFKRKNPAEFFAAFMAVSLIIYLIASLIWGGKVLCGIFFADGTDLFMDFFNSVRDVSQGKGVYTDRGVIYPPMANLIFLLCLRLIPEEYATTPFDQRHNWVNYPSAIIACLLFLLVFVLLFFFLCGNRIRFSGKKKTLFCFFILLNVPMLSLLERGNIILLSTLASAVFLFFYQSENKAARELSLVALAFSFSLKLYPAAFGWLLIADKRYKEALRCALYGILLLLLPSFFFGGPKCLVWMLENVADFSSGSGAWTSLAKTLHVPEQLLKIFFMALLVFAVAMFVAASYLQKERWKVILFACTLFMCVPSIHATYAWGIFLVPLIYLCNKKDQLKGIDWAYFVFLILPFLFIPGNPDLHHFLGNGAAISDICILLSTVVLGIICLVDTFKAINGRRKSGGTFSELSAQK